MGKFILKYEAVIFLLLITLMGLFFYSFRLKETQLFRDDTARDTLKILRIWQNKELTMIGPPISFTQRSIREAYLGSLFLYVGLIGLLLTDWDPVGAVLPNVLFFTISIPFFYLITIRLTSSFLKRLIATTLYALSPVTVTHARFFWNPNLIIPASVFFWYLVLKKDNSKISTMINFLFAGILGGVMFNFHYLAAVPLVIYTATLVFAKQFVKGLAVSVGLIIGFVPIIIFELRNNFYLTQALLQNLFQGKGPNGFNLTEGIYYFFGVFWSILGLRQSEIDFPILFRQNILTDQVLLIITLITAGVVILRRVKADQKIGLFWPAMGVAFLLTIYFSSGNPVRVRYLFSVYPLIIWLIVDFFWRLKTRLAILLFVPVIAASVLIIANKLSLKNNFIALSLIEDICGEIVKDNPAGSYNITENLKGDARAMSFRYCVTKDAKFKPNDEFSYNNLNSIYVISPTIEKIYKDSRWEFYASGPWKLLTIKDFGEVKLFKFVKDRNDENRI